MIFGGLQGHGRTRALDRANRALHRKAALGSINDASGGWNFYSL